MRQIAEGINGHFTLAARLLGGVASTAAEGSGSAPWWPPRHSVIVLLWRPGRCANYQMCRVSPFQLSQSLRHFQVFSYFQNFFPNRLTLETKKFRQNTGDGMNAPWGKSATGHLRSDEMEFAFNDKSETWNTSFCVTLWYFLLDGVLLAICQTFHQTDISFLLMYGLYTPMCQSSRKVKDCRATQKGRRVEWGWWGGQENTGRCHLGFR